MKITAIVITENEEKNIKDCLESIKWADEILVVDSKSTDETIALAKNYTDSILSTEIKSVTEKRIFSIDKASNEWILFIDADERATAELASEISALRETDDIDAYYINRDNIYLGRTIKHSGMNPDYHIRLFNRNKAAITNRIVHEGIEVQGKTCKLTSKIIHYTVPDLNVLISKMNYYSTLEAQEHFDNKKKISKAGAFTHAISAFIRTYLSRKGFLDGLPGFYLSLAEAATNFLTQLKLLKLQDKL